MDSTEYKSLGLNSIPKVCPTCLDKNQNRPDMTLSRQAVFEIVCKISSLPPYCKWKEHIDPLAAGNKISPVYHAVIKGDQFGAEWNGRIDVWAIMPEPPKIGQLVKLTEMEVVKIVTKQKWSRETMHHGLVSGYKQVPIGTEGAEKFEEKRVYVRLEPANETSEKSSPQLVWVQAYSKTTLKGFGRQYRASLSGSPIWKKEVMGGYRSGRASTIAWLAVVNNDNFIKLSHSENKEISETYFPRNV